MSEKTLSNIRIVNKHDTESNWLKATGFIPKKGELIVYDKDSTYNYERFKIGDGSTVVSSLPFADANKVDKVSGKGLSTNDYTTTEKNKLAGIAEGANKTVVDSALSASSTNPVQNKVVNAAISSLNELVGDKKISEELARKSDIGHTHDDKYYTESEIDTKLSGKSDSGHTHSAYVNQNAFSKVTVGSTTIEADSATDTLTLVAGSNVTLTPDASGDKITIAATDTVYTHPNSGVTAGTYKSVTVNAQGHVTAGTNPTTLSGYGITDAATKTEVSAINALVGDKKVSDQISEAIANKSNTDHTHNYAGSSSAGGAANSVKTNLTVKLNSGSTEGTNLFTYNGSTAKTINITPSAIGAAASSHGNHVPAVETADNAKFLRNDNTWQTITPSNIGAAASSHGTHVSYSTTAPVMDGTASVGSASTVARSDHKHPTDTSRAAASDLTALQSLVGDKKVSEQIAAAQLVYVGPTMPTDPNIKVWINTAEEGTGVIPVLPRIATVTLPKANWTGSASPYSQTVTIATVTSATKIDLQPTAAQIVQLQNADIALMAENSGDTVKIYSFGGKPSSDMTMQVLLTEVSYV